MTPSRWRRIKDLLDEMEEQAPAARQAWLEARCSDDADLLAEVEDFLGRENRLEGFLETSAASHLDLAAPDVAESEEVGNRIGPYRVIGELGHGGMGAVYEAVREDDFEQRVALKLVLAGRDHPRILRLFQNERQILARLEHPNIARLLDGGADRLGRPYFAMELIEGEPLDQYCDHHRLTVRERLELVLQVCDALDMAHRNLVVHRDIKPGNVLVDSGGTPKLLDFGIAKLIEPDAGTLATQSGSQPLTLHYASPEQLSNEPITPASDIYSLGVLLYRLLAGVLPNEIEKLGYLKLVLAVCKEEPKAPSAVSVGFEPKTAVEIAELRGTDPVRLRRELAGDVDAILLKALRKEPGLRYGTVRQLAADIRRFLNGRPVAAREGNWTYRAGKFARRNRWTLGIGAVVLAVVLSLSSLYVMQAEKTADALDRTEDVRDFLLRIFEKAAPYGSESPEDLPAWNRILETVSDMLDEDELSDEDRGLVQRGMAQAYYKLGDFDKAGQLLQEAVSLLRQARVRSGVTAWALTDLGAVRLAQGRLAEAEEYFQEAIRIHEEEGRPALNPKNNLAALYRAQGRIAEAEMLLRDVLSIRRDYAGGRPGLRLIAALRTVATVLLDQGEPEDLEESEALLREALALCRELERESAEAPEPFREDDREYVDVRVTLGRVMQEQGEPAEALELFQTAARMREARLGPEDRLLGLIQKDLASVFVDLDRLEEARDRLASARRILERSNRHNDPELADVDSLTGVIAIKEGRVEEGLRLLEQSRRRFAEGSPATRLARLADERLRAFSPGAAPGG